MAGPLLATIIFNCLSSGETTDAQLLFAANLFYHSPLLFTLAARVTSKGKRCLCVLCETLSDLQRLKRRLNAGGR